MSIDFPSLHAQDMDALRERAASLGMASEPPQNKADLAFHVGRALGEQKGETFGRGVLETHAEGFGFLRSATANFLPGEDDIYVSQSQIRRFKLRTGDTVIGLVRPPKEGERYFALLRVESVNGDAPGGEPYPAFEQLTAIYPDERLDLSAAEEWKPIDYVAPLGLGQRGLLLVPQHTSPSPLLRSLAATLAADEGLHVTALLVGARPEDIQQWRSDTTVEVIATPFEETAARQLQVAEIVLERARRMVELGEDVALIVDGFSTILRASVGECEPSGRLIDGIDTAALQGVRRFFGSGRALEDGGSLTVVGTCLDASHPRDRALTRDLADAANWVVVLHPDVAVRGLTPPVDVRRSANLCVERLLSEDDARARAAWRAELGDDPIANAQALLEICRA